MGQGSNQMMWDTENRSFFVSFFNCFQALALQLGRPLPVILWNDACTSLRPTMIAQGQQGQMGVTAPMAKFPGQQQQMLVLSSVRFVAFMLSIFESLKLWVSCLRWCRWCWQAQTNTAMGRRGADLEKLGKFFRELLEFSDPKLSQIDHSALAGLRHAGPNAGPRHYATTRWRPTGRLHMSLMNGQL